MAHFDNPVQLLASAAIGKARRGAGDLVFRSGELTVATPTSRGAVFPIYEVFAEDTYRLAWITQAITHGAHALDVGAHVGSFSLAFARRVPHARVAAYEASPTTARYLRRNVRASRMGDRVSCHAEAISEVAGTIEFADNDCCSPLNARSGRFGGTVIHVPSVRMETAFQRLDDHVDFVKIDAEGAEYDMVLSSPPNLWHSVSRVVLEYHDVEGHSEGELIDFFAAAGLRVADQEPMLGNPREGLLWFSRAPLREPFQR
jgi:FkbM family methyltransferase